MTATRKIYPNQVNFKFEPVPNCLTSNAAGIFAVSDVFAYISKCLTFNPNTPISIKGISTYCNDLDRRIVIKSIAFLCLSNIIIIDSVTRHGLYMRLNYEFIELKSDKTFDVAFRNQGSFSRDNNKKLKIYLNALCDIGLGDIVARKDHHTEQYMSLKLKGKVVNLKKHMKANGDRIGGSQSLKSKSLKNLDFITDVDRTERSLTIAQSDHTSIAQSDHKSPFSIAQSDHIRDLFETKIDTAEETKSNAAAAEVKQTSLGSDMLSLGIIPIRSVEKVVGFSSKAVTENESEPSAEIAVMVDQDAIGKASVNEIATHNRIEPKTLATTKPKGQEELVAEVISQVTDHCSAELINPDREEIDKIGCLASCFIAEYRKHHPNGKKLTKSLLNRFETYLPFIVSSFYDKGATKDEVELFVEALWTIEAFGNEFLSKVISRDDLGELGKTYQGRKVFDDVYELMMKSAKPKVNFFESKYFETYDWGDIEF